MRLRWTPAAADDLEQISNYLREHHPQFQQPTIRKLYQRICDLPLPYVAVYRVKADAIEILRISHLAQERRQ